jgi:hypothetical protein
MAGLSLGGLAAIIPIFLWGRPAAEKITWFLFTFYSLRVTFPNGSFADSQANCGSAKISAARNLWLSKADLIFLTRADISVRIGLDSESN